VIVAIPVVITVAAIPPAAMRDAEHALDGADRAADTGSDSAAHDTTDGTRDATAFIGAFLRAAHDALRMCGVRNCQQRKRARGGGKNPT
jgi:hypothetical protein